MCHQQGSHQSGGGGQLVNQLISFTWWMINYVSPSVSSSEVSMTMCMGMTAIQRKIPKWLPFNNISQNNLKSNDHILEAYVYIHVKDEVSMTTYMDRRACKRKLPNFLPFKNYKSKSLNI